MRTQKFVASSFSAASQHTKQTGFFKAFHRPRNIRFGQARDFADPAIGNRGAVWKRSSYGWKGAILITVYFTSDLHFGHTNIIKHYDRPFESAEQMNQHIIANINAIVGQRDTLYILGDFTGPQIKRDEAMAYRKKILCKHVHLIQGNHYKDFRGTGCFESDTYYQKLKLNGHKLILFHYPIAEWDGKWRGAIHLHGHSHNKPKYNDRNIEQGLLRFDVGVDANDYMPVSEDKIFELAGQAEVNANFGSSR